MDCEQYKDALNAAALDSLAGAKAEAFGFHLEVCEACRRELGLRSEFGRALDRQLRTQLAADPSATFNARLRRRIATESEHAPRPLLGWTPIVAGVASVVILLVLMHYRAGSGVASPTTASGRAPVQSSPVAAQLTPSSGESSQPRAASAKPSNRESIPLLHPVGLARTPAPELKVRIDPREERAVERFESGRASGRINTTPLVQSASLQHGDQMAELTPLTIPPLELPPLERPSLEGTRE